MVMVEMSWGWTAQNQQRGGSSPPPQDNFCSWECPQQEGAVESVKKYLVDKEQAEVPLQECNEVDDCRTEH
eukprot:scaffold1907_cov73-Skeletonema_dohrnii-CCMP3373.AAC.15